MRGRLRAHGRAHPPQHRPDGAPARRQRRPPLVPGNVLPVAYQMTELNSQDGEVLLESLEVSCGTISRETVSGYENIQREQTAEGGSGGNGGAG